MVPIVEKRGQLRLSSVHIRLYPNSSFQKYPSDYEYLLGKNADAETYARIYTKSLFLKGIESGISFGTLNIHLFWNPKQIFGF